MMESLATARSVVNGPGWIVYLPSMGHPLLDSRAGDPPEEGASVVQLGSGSDGCPACTGPMR